MSKTFTGNLCADPELTYTKSGKAVVNVRIAENRRFVFDDKTQQTTTFYTLVAWDTLAENLAASTRQGDLVVVEGNLKIEEYDTDDGKRTAVKIVATNIGASLRFATVDITKNPKEAPDDQVA